VSDHSSKLAKIVRHIAESAKHWKNGEHRLLIAILCFAIFRSPSEAGLYNGMAHSYWQPQQQAGNPTIGFICFSSSDFPFGHREL